ncbi:MAG: hypothetical protein IPL08_07830 [Saprospiraceae bacterium]|nr:hypothetical protein [Saprospiraceae bacterium]
MKFFSIILIYFSGWINPLQSQKSTPVSWTFDLTKISDAEYELKATATMQPMWVIYSQFTEDGGPIPTYFTVDGTNVKFTEKSKVIKEFDALFDVNVMKFKEKAVFIAQISKTTNDVVKGSVEFMTCDGSRCLPPTEVTFDLKF